MTKGPWYYVTGAVWTTPQGPDDGGECVAMRASRSNILPTDRDDNLRLCASAQELLQLLSAIDAFWGDSVCDAAIHPGAYITDQDIPIRDLIHVAVCKAKGIAKP